MSNTLEQSIIAIIEQILKKPEGTLDIDSGMGITEGWDSLKMMEIVMAVEKQYAIQFDPEVLYETVSVRDLIIALQALDCETAIKTHCVVLPENLEQALISLVAILSSEKTGKSSLIWIFSGYHDEDYLQDAEQVIALYSGRHNLIFVVPDYLKEIAAENHQTQAKILLVDNPAFFSLAQKMRLNCTHKIGGQNFLFQRRTLFVSPTMLKTYAEEANHDYEFSELQVECVPRGVIHPLELSETGQGENREYGGVTDANLQFVDLSATSRINGRYQKSWPPAPEWYVGANPLLKPESIPYVDQDIVFLGPLHKHYGHFILESLARLWFFLEAQNKRYLAAYISSPDEDRFNDVFGFFGIKAEQLIKIDRPTRFRSVIVPEMSIRLHDRYHIQYKATIDQIKSAIKPAHYKKVFFAKKMRRNYRGMGEQPIVDIFRENGFHIAYPETLSMYETIATLKGCEVFAASSGSNAHNAIFLEDNVEVICLNRSPHIHYPQTMIERMKGLRVFYVDAYLAVLPADWSTGPFLFGPNKGLLDFMPYKGFSYNYTNFVYSMTAYIYEYIRIWGLYYSDETRRELIDPQDRNLSIASVSQSITEVLGHLPLNIMTRYE